MRKTVNTERQRRTFTLAVRVDADTKRAIERAAEAHLWSVSLWLSQAAEAALKMEPVLWGDVGREGP